MNIYLSVQSVSGWKSAYMDFEDNLRNSNITNIDEVIAKHYPEDKRDHDSVTLDLFEGYIELRNQLKTKKLVDHWDLPLDYFNAQIFCIDGYVGFDLQNVTDRRFRFLLPKRLKLTDTSVSVSFAERLNEYFKLESIPMDTALNAYWVSDIPDVHKLVAKAVGVRGGSLPLARFKTNTIVEYEVARSVHIALRYNNVPVTAQVLKELDFKLPVSLPGLITYLTASGNI